METNVRTKWRRRRLRNKDGFTLAELLIVVAIIGVLVAISIPIFSNQLEKSREATDAANIRAAYADVASSVNLEGEVESVTNNHPWAVAIRRTTIEQTQSGWQNKSIEDSLKELFKGDDKIDTHLEGIAENKTAFVVYGPKGEENQHFELWDNYTP